MEVTICDHIMRREALNCERDSVPWSYNEKGDLGRDGVLWSYNEKEDIGLW